MAVSPTSSTTTSGIDVASLVSQLMVVERQPETALNAKVTSSQTKISALGGIKSAVSSFQTALQALKSGGSFQAFTATPADTSILTASTSSTAVAGNYSLNITSLAQSQQLVTTGQASSTTAIGSGATTTLSFDFGTISGGTFNATTGAYTGAGFTSNGSGVKTVTIDSTNNTLQGISNAINAANIGVSATIVNDGSGTPYRLALTSTASGSANSLSISASGDAAVSGLLANDPTGTQNLSQTVTAQNANFTVNGIAISKPSNTVTDAIQGVTLNLSKVTTTPTSLTVSKDTAGISAAAASFVTAYNSLYNSLQSVSTYDPATKTSGTLFGDSSITLMQSQLRSILTTPVTGGAYSMLSQVGITTQAGGTLVMDSTKFNAAVASNMTDLSNLFTSSGGLATKLDQWASTSLNVTILNHTASINQQITRYNNQIADMETRMLGIQTRYTKQFTALDSLLATMNSTSTYLTQQIASMTANR